MRGKESDRQLGSGLGDKFLRDFHYHLQFRDEVTETQQSIANLS